MTRPVTNRRAGRSIGAALIGAVLLSLGGVAAADPAWSQTTGQEKGVAKWQAQRAIEDYANRFVTRQREYGLAKLGTADFSVRVKIEALTRVENKDLGTIWMAQFSGAILPDVYNKDAVQGYAHGILKIYMDKNKGVQVVVNEGQGIWTMSQKTSILYDDLPKELGDWKAWGGPGDEPEPRNPIASGTPKLDHQPPNIGKNRLPPPPGDPVIVALRAEADKARAEFDRLKNQSGPKPPGLQAAFDKWQAAERKYMEAIVAGPKK